MRAFISAIFLCASIFFLSNSDVPFVLGTGAGLGLTTEIGVGASPVPDDFIAACLALMAAIRSASSLFFLSASVSPFPIVGGAVGAGEPLLERMRFESPEGLSASRARLPLILTSCRCGISEGSRSGLE